jgi:hypothetical protein
VESRIQVGKVSGSYGWIVPSFLGKFWFANARRYRPKTRMQPGCDRGRGPLSPYTVPRVCATGLTKLRATQASETAPAQRWHPDRCSRRECGPLANFAECMECEISPPYRR